MTVRTRILTHMDVIYDIPRTIEYDPEQDTVELHMLSTDGNVDSGPHYRLTYNATFVGPVNAGAAARIVGNHLGRNYSDEFRQVEVKWHGKPSRHWVAVVHLAWGDRPYYTEIVADPTDEIEDAVHEVLGGDAPQEFKDFVDRLTRVTAALYRVAHHGDVPA